MADKVKLETFVDHQTKRMIEALAQKDGVSVAAKMRMILINAGEAEAKTKGIARRRAG